MQFIQTQSIILQKTLINDFKYIIKLYSETHGLISASVEINNFIQAAHVQVPNICHFQLTLNKYQKYAVKDLKPAYIYKQLLNDYKKNIIAQLVTEVILKSVKETFSDTKLFHLLRDSLIQLDNLEQKFLPFYHLYFIKHFLIISGHYPLNNYDSKNIYFSLSDGKFSSVLDQHALPKEDSQCLLYFFFDPKFKMSDGFPVFSMTHHLINYMKHHINIGELQSLPFLKEALMEFQI